MKYDLILYQRKLIRQHIRHLRQNLSFLDQQKSASQISKIAINFTPVFQAKKIAIFVSFDGEINTDQLIKQLWQRNKQVCLPVIDQVNQILFMQYTSLTLMILNRFNIPEPLLDFRKILPLETIDIIFIPLVAFDAFGNRLGMGGGYYDRLLQHRDSYKFLSIGLAYDFQQVAAIPITTWDVPLTALITPSKIWQWN
ncbi:MAG: 5-formyltetrahydrofolate cyclo-ligase [Candidatus Dasytiphilus stammeri]